MRKRKDNLIRCILALLCLFRIFMPAAIRADDDHKGEVTVTIITDVVRIDADDHDVTETDIGDIHVENDPESENTKGYALDVSAADGYTATVSTGSVELSKDSQESGYYYAVNIDANEGGHADVTTGNVDVNGMTKDNDTVTGVRVDVDSMFDGGSSAKVTNGNITVNNGTTKPEETGLDVDARAGFSAGKTASAEIKTGDITVSNGDGISASANMKGSEIKVESEKITNSNGNGVSAKATLGETEVSVKDIETVNGTGAYAYAIGQAETTVSSENITVTNGAGIKGEALNNGSVSITADSVTVNGEGVGLDIIAQNNMNSESKGLYPQEVTDAVADLEKELNRKLTEDEVNGLLGSMTERAGEKVEVLIDGDVQAATGISLDVGSSGAVDILIDGTLKANTPITFSETSDLSNTSITLRKIEQEVARRAAADADPLKDVINYIVDIRQGEENIFTVVKANGDALNTKHDYNVANLGDELVLKVNDGYSITKAYNNGVELQKDEQGRYILNVPFGGNLNFSVDYEKVDPIPGPDPGPDEDPDKGSSESSADRSKEEKIVVRFVPPTTGIETSFARSNMMKKIIIHTLDALIISLFLLSLNGRRNRNQFVNTLPDSLR